MIALSNVIFVYGLKQLQNLKKSESFFLDPQVKIMFVPLLKECQDLLL